MPKVTIARISTALGILLLVLVGWRAYLGTASLIEHEQEMGRDHEIIHALDTILIYVQHAETGQRGYLLTGNEAYLTPYEYGISSLQDALDTLESLVVTDPEQQASMQRLRRNIDAKLAELHETVVARKSNNAEAALAIVNPDEGQRLMREIRADQGDMEAHQQKLLSQRTQQANLKRSHALSLLVGSIAVAALLFLASGIIVSWELFQSRKDLSTLSESQDFLTQLLAAHPTKSIVIASDGRVMEGQSATSPDPTETTAADGINEPFERAIQRLGDFSREDSSWLGEGISSVIDGDEPHLQGELSEGSPHSEKYYAINAKPVVMEGERCALLCLTDVSPLRSALEAARVSEEVFRLAMNNAPIGMALVSPEGKWLRVNRAICELVGYSEEELLVTDFQTITHPEDLDKDLALLQQMLRREIDFYHMEKRYIRKNGEHVWILLSVSLVWDNEDKPRYFISQIQDIDARKKAEAALQISKERLELALQAGQLGTWDWDVLADEVHYDDRWAEMLGYQLAEVAPLRATWEKAIHPDDKANVMAALEAHLDGETETYEAEHRLQHKDGSWVWILTKGKVIERDQNGKPLRLCGTHLDVTLQRHAQEELAAFAQALERSNKELEDFAHIASHDLKEPLRGIRNYSTFLLEDYEDVLDEDGQNKLHTLVRLTSRLEDLIEELLHYSRVGRTEIALQPVNLHEAVTDIVDSIAGWLEEYNGHVIVEDSLPTTHCHQVLAAEVFRNLITNGIKYNDSERKQIEVGALHHEDGKTVFFVRDNGIGIASRYNETIFRIFKRLHGRDKFGGGTGAGLSITQKIVRRHGGRIWLESEEGQGTTFFFTLQDDGNSTEDHD